MNQRAGGPLDTLGPSTPGRYDDGLVEVVRGGDHDASDAVTVARTRHFCLHRNGDRLRIGHRIPPEQLDNDLAGLLRHELFAPGWLSSSVDIFERVFTGVVKTTVDDPGRAWSLFYDNTLEHIRRLWTAEPGPRCSAIAEIVPVYRRSLELVPPGRVLDVGSCFGFLAMLLAARAGTEVIAADIDQGSIDLLRRMARQRRTPVGTLVCDAARIPLPDGAVDTVLAVHLLEHLEPVHGAAVLAEALRLARERVVIAVPFEPEPTAAYGHVRTFDLPALEELGRGAGAHFRVEEHHGGWLVIDRR
ncbi:MAG: class I SAM-dependent methyltransferase [Saccharopolyspora sp.]|uniref:mycofactocin oligosaccharide methyltransferase MftM n=1 Tax=Saccharopolyspora TaxID=1835 RepID=UPI00190DDD0C|nr:MULTISPECIES: mycofactocin oligosaccharide methyltransferase MftM [unclassified Saccharopolyspora]MBK0870090.1 class I SAM-dependent methyltransferase [Saccharopolyspora sp. HNM0986]MBQ6644241.1 class I SAM-dependent methyltransferase [Saccharopolyspora sp.]